MKSKFQAGLVATLVCLVVVVGAAVALTAFLGSGNERLLIKVVAFATIGIWLGIYGWLKPKQNPVSSEQREQPKTETTTEAPKRDRNSYH